MNLPSGLGRCSIRVVSKRVTPSKNRLRFVVQPRTSLVASHFYPTRKPVPFMDSLRESLGNEKWNHPGLPGNPQNPFWPWNELGVWRNSGTPKEVSGTNRDLQGPGRGNGLAKKTNRWTRLSMKGLKKGGGSPFVVCQKGWGPFWLVSSREIHGTNASFGLMSEQTPKGNPPFGGSLGLRNTLGSDGSEPWFPAGSDKRKPETPPIQRIQAI